MNVRRVLIIFFSLVLLLFAGEFAVRTFSPQELISDVIILSPEICHRLKADATGVQSSREYSVRFKTNKWGFRDDEISLQKASNEKRILILGDSHTFGWGVDFPDIFCTRLQKMLNVEQSDQFIRVLNFGTMGYATGHQYEALQRYGYAFRPDVVIVAMDLLHDIMLNNRYFEINNRVLRNDVPCYFKRSRVVSRYLPFSGYLRGHSHLFRFLGFKVFAFVKHGFQPDDGQHDSAGTGTYDLRKTEEIFRMLKEELNRKHIQFAVIILPEFLDYDKQLLAEFQQYLRREDIPFVSTQEKFEQISLTRKLAFRYSEHLNSAGHEFVSNEISNFLTERGYLQ